MHDAARHRDLLGRRQRRLDLGKQPEQAPARQLRAIIMDLQRADAGGEVDDAGKAGLHDRLHQQVHPQPQRDIERHRPIFDEQIVVALAAINDGNRAILADAEDRRTCFFRGPPHCRAGDRVFRPRHARQRHLQP